VKHIAAQIVQNTPDTAQPVVRRLAVPLLRCKMFPAAGLLFATALTGCGIGTIDTTANVSVAMHGTVHGGQQPVTNGNILLYAAGTIGNASMATQLIPAASYSLGGAPGCSTAGGNTCYTAVYTDGNGNFNISGDYKCPTYGTQVYLAAVGGNPGLTPSTTTPNPNNPALVLVEALGSCGALSNTTNVYINEVSTVAAAWALAPFASSATQVGSSSTNSAGIANAFLNSSLLVGEGTGAAAPLPSNLTIETGKLYALANVLASCVNSDGTAGCTALFAAATTPNGTVPADTFSAALDIVQNPGYNVVGVYDVISPFSPFPPPFNSTLTQAPNDWTMSLTASGGGLDMPTAMAIDQASNVWVTGQAGPLAEFNPQGTPLSGTGYALGTTDIEQANSLVVDTLGDIWIAQYNSQPNPPGSVAKFMGSTSGSPGTLVPGTFGTSAFFDSSIQYPNGLSADTNGDIFIANNGSSSATVYNSSGQLVAASLGLNDNLYGEPQAVAADSSHGFWLSNSDYTIAHIDQNGNLLSHPNCCYQSYGLATDSVGNVWVANFLNNSFSEVGPSGTLPIPINQSSVGGLYRPAQVVVDANQNVWFSNLYGQTISEIAGVNAARPFTTGAAISPTAGVYGTGGYGLDAGLSNPFSIAVDTAGNVWVSNEGKTSITMFFGLATPTTTPVQPIPTAP
jgi:streptogramin lyase